MRTEVWKLLGLCFALLSVASAVATGAVGATLWVAPLACLTVAFLTLALAALLRPSSLG